MQQAEPRAHWLMCLECGSEFAFEVGEQRFYDEHDLVVPKRCPACRKRRKREADSNGT